MICLLVITNKPLSFVFVLEVPVTLGTGHTCPELINRNYQCSLGQCPLNFSVYKMNISLLNKVIKLLYYSTFTGMEVCPAFVPVKFASP